MNINKELTGTALTLTVSGRLDTLTAPMLEQEIKASCGDITELTLDFQELQYISSAGLRVVLGAHKAMKPVLNPRNCVGCHLCVLVCPEQAIVPGRARVSRKESE